MAWVPFRMKGVRPTMSNSRPTFEKKEKALSATPYVYFPADVKFLTYAVEITHEDEVDADLLQKALDRHPWNFSWKNSPGEPKDPC